MKKTMIHKMIGLIFAAVVAVCVWGAPITAFAEGEVSVSEEAVIPEGVYIDETHVGGMTIAAAKEQLKQKEDQIRASELTLTQGEQVLTIPVTELGLTFQDTTELLYHAATVGQTGTLVQRYKELKDLENDRVICTWSYSVDLTLLEEKLSGFAETVKVEMEDATINRENDQWFRTPSVEGIELDIEATTELIRTAFEGWDGQSVTLEVAVEVIEPKYTTEMLDTITEIIGSHVSFIDGNIETGRGWNVYHGSQMMHGTILLPGESYSVFEALSPFTYENGYEDAIAFNDGGYVDSVGGGICQLSSTLYNALLDAELQIDKRWNHSMAVNYVPYGLDATINDNGSKDLVFTNNYDFPIYIQASVWSESETFGQVYFAIWGTMTDEIRERVVEMYYKEIEREDAEVIYTVDPKLDPGEEIWDQQPYPKLKIEVYKKVTIDGEVVSDELLYTDNYIRSDGKVRHNPIEESTDPEEDTSEEVTEDGSEEDTSGEITEENPSEGTTEGTEVETNTSGESTEEPTEAPEQTESTSGENAQSGSETTAEAEEPTEGETGTVGE